ncbi:hypothetical protein K438DRAFT_1848959, partial [Mycena galopus ATCC 62051]
VGGRVRSRRSKCAFEVGKWLGRGMSQGVRSVGSECGTFEEQGCGGDMSEAGRWASGGPAFEEGRTFQVGGRVWIRGGQRAHAQGNAKRGACADAFEVGGRAFEVDGAESMCAGSKHGESGLSK